jgi:hypothetical protein
MKVLNKDGVSFTIAVATKQLHYMPITPRLERLFLSKEIETTMQMRWYKEEKHDSEDFNIMSHPTDGEAWHALDYFDPKFARHPRSVPLGWFLTSQPTNMVFFKTLFSICLGRQRAEGHVFLM